MALTIDTDTQNDILDSAISGSATLALYTAPRPASASDPATGTLLVTYTGINFSTAVGGVKSQSAPVEATNVASGTAAWYRFSNGDRVTDGEVGADLALDSANLTSGEKTLLHGLSYIQPAGTA
ncbi:MAG: hypothetical protein AAF512_02535 [Pseudomonadota bacterium]